MILFKKFTINRLTKKLKALHQHRALNQASHEEIKREIDFYLKLAHIYESLVGSKKYPFARDQALACYKAAASLNDAESDFHVGKLLIEEARCLQKLQESGIFGSQSNERRMRQLYEEGHAYLEAGEKLNHILAKRYRGLCYINGWGVSEDKKFGFELIMESIDQENSWDRVPQLFASMGLNKPEFFSALASHKKHQY